MKLATEETVEVVAVETKQEDEEASISLWLIRTLVCLQLILLTNPDSALLLK